jgi:peptidoglycan DL-endopeptidase CwlO
MKKPISRFYLLLVLVPLLLLASMGGYYFLEETAAGSDVVVVPQTPAPPSATPVPVPTPEPTPTPFPEHDITLMAVGDNLMHLGVVASGKQEDGTYDFSMLFQGISPFLNAADIRIINQETVMGGNSRGFSGFPYFNSPTVVGKIYDGAVAQILDVAGEDQDWFRIISGNVEGYIKAEFFIYGDAAAEVVDNYVTRYAVVIADRLNVRQDPATDAKRIGYIDNGEKVKILENDGDWLKVQYTDSKEGYVSAEYVTISEEFIYAKTIEEEQAEIAAQKALQAREQTAEQDAPEVITNITLPTTTYTSNAELRQGIIDYAMQYLGNRYVHGGSSLSGGTDCSGFTCFIYAEFGYSISRTPGGQYSGAGRSISSEELQPGDIVCYSSNGGKSCTHVGLYIGDGQIIHSANSRKGVIISAVDYSPIIGMRNVID